MRDHALSTTISIRDSTLICLAGRINSCRVARRPARAQAIQAERTRIQSVHGRRRVSTMPTRQHDNHDAAEGAAYGPLPNPHGTGLLRLMPSALAHTALQPPASPPLPFASPALHSLTSSLVRQRCLATPTHKPKSQTAASVMLRTTAHRPPTEATPSTSMPTQARLPSTTRRGAVAMIMLVPNFLPPTHPTGSAPFAIRRIH